MSLPVQRQLVEAFNERNAVRIAELYAEDAVFVMPGRPPVVGRPAIVRAMEEDFRDESFSLELAEQKTEEFGDLAYARGTFRVRFTVPGTAGIQSVAGNYLQVFRKQPDDSWQIAEDISSPGP